MVLEELISLLESPDSVTEDDVADLEALVEYAPYCNAARLLLQKAYFQSHNKSFNTTLHLAAMSASNRKELYYLLYPKQIIRHQHRSQDYFSLVQHLEDKAASEGESFAALAERFRQARLMMK